MSKNLSYHIVVSGKVTGVAYRAWAKAKAESLGVTGWIRNLSSGQVEMLITGTEEKLNEMAKAAATGSFAARVVDVHAHRHPLEEFTEFSIAPDSGHSMHG